MNAADVYKIINRFPYAGIGSRRITRDSSYIMMWYACAMAFSGGRMRSGAADGSDTSYEVGAKIAYDAMVKHFGLPPGEYGNVIEVFLPWPNFNGRKVAPKAGYHHLESEEAMQMAALHHPNWENLGRAARSMMSRNSNQGMGADMRSPSRFVMCETPDGAFDKTTTSPKTGGTGQAIRIADSHGINVYNIKRTDHLAKVMAWLEDAEVKIREQFGLSPKKLVDEFLEAFIGFENRVEGDLVQMAAKGDVDVLVHGCNCFHMNSGIAKSVRETFPESYKRFMAGRKGDKKRLGTIDVIPLKHEGRDLTIINAYTQFNWGRVPDVLYVDYEAVRKSFKQIAQEISPNARIGIPRIGAGLGNGCWVTISNIIAQEMKGHNVILVDYNPEELSLQNEVLAEKEKEAPQISLF